VNHVFYKSINVIYQMNAALVSIRDFQNIFFKMTTCEQ